jgi:hypothetical protein
VVPHFSLGLHLLMDGKCVEMWMQGQCLQSELLADTKLQAVGDRELVKGKKNASGTLPEAFCELF